MPPMARLNRLFTLYFPSIRAVFVWRSSRHEVWDQISGDYAALNLRNIILVLLNIQKVSYLAFLINLKLSKYRVLGRRFFHLPLLSNLLGHISVGFCDRVIISSRNIFLVFVVFHLLRCRFPIVVLARFLIL